MVEKICKSFSKINALKSDSDIVCLTPNNSLDSSILVWINFFSLHLVTVKRRKSTRLTKTFFQAWPHFGAFFNQFLN